MYVWISFFPEKLVVNPHTDWLFVFFWSSDDPVLRITLGIFQTQVFSIFLVSFLITISRLLSDFFWFFSGTFFVYDRWFKVCITGFPFFQGIRTNVLTRCFLIFWFSDDPELSIMVGCFQRQVVVLDATRFDIDGWVSINQFKVLGTMQHRAKAIKCEGGK